MIKIRMERSIGLIKLSGLQMHSVYYFASNEPSPEKNLVFSHQLISYIDLNHTTGVYFRNRMRLSISDSR